MSVMEPLSPEPESLAAFYEKGYTVTDPAEAERLGRELAAELLDRGAAELMAASR